MQLTPRMWWFDKLIPCRGPHDLLHAAPNSRQGDRGRLVEDTPGAEPGCKGIIASRLRLRHDERRSCESRALLARPVLLAKERTNCEESIGLVGVVEIEIASLTSKFHWQK